MDVKYESDLILAEMIVNLESSPGMDCRSNYKPEPGLPVEMIRNFQEGVGFNGNRPPCVASPFGFKNITPELNLYSFYDYFTVLFPVISCPL